MSDELLEQTNKRLTLNLLIQGAAAHTFLTAQHLVREELDSLSPGLTSLYDRFAIGFHLNYWIGDITLFYGLPSWFWWRTGSPKHPFHRHPFLSRYGGQLSRASKKYLLARGWKKRVIGIPGVLTLQLYINLIKTMRNEVAHHQELSELAAKATSLVWGIPEHRLEPYLTVDVEFGSLRTPKTRVGRLTRHGAVGYGGVERYGSEFQVVARAYNWPLVVHELSKGVAELVCLHGLADLDDKTYEAATDEADQLEYETWLLQAGADMWRRLLAAIPRDRKVADVLMHLARLEPPSLESLMFQLMDVPDEARNRIAGLG